MEKFMTRVYYAYMCGDGNGDGDRSRGNGAGMGTEVAGTVRGWGQKSRERSGMGRNFCPRVTLYFL